jgi:hypothetical protein
VGELRVQFFLKLIIHNQDSLKLIPFSEVTASFQTACLSPAFSGNSSNFLQILWWFSHRRSVELLLLTNMFHWGFFLTLLVYLRPLLRQHKHFVSPAKSSLFTP